MQAYIKRLERKMTIQYQMTARQSFAVTHLKRKLEFCILCVLPIRVHDLQKLLVQLFVYSVYKTQQVKGQYQGTQSNKIGSITTK